MRSCKENTKGEEWLKYTTSIADSEGKSVKKLSEIYDQLWPSMFNK